MLSDAAKKVEPTAKLLDDGSGDCKPKMSVSYQSESTAPDEALQTDKHMLEADRVTQTEAGKSVTGVNVNVTPSVSASVREDLTLGDDTHS